MIEFRHRGDFSKTTAFLERCKELFRSSNFDKYGKAGVEALSSATPRDTGKTAASWSYEIEHNNGSTSIIFKNSNMTKLGVPVAILIQYGHGTKNGGFVEGIDYINPALRPVFEQIANDAWKEVTR